MDFSEENHASTLIDPLLEVLAKFHGDENFIGAAPFDLLSDAVLPGYLQTREELQNNDVEEDDQVSYSQSIINPFSVSTYSQGAKT